MEIFLFIIGALIFYIMVSSQKPSPSPRKTHTPKNDKSRSRRLRSTFSTTQSRSNQNRSDDELATFTLSYGRREVRSQNRTPGKWILPNQTTDIKGLNSTKGMFYVGGHLPTRQGYGAEASLIDESLSMEPRPMTYRDDSLGYWPSYSTISPGCRGAYISWLSSSRDNPSTPLGYVFIYFYGLERRIVIDSLHNSVEDAEFKTIFDEVLRLQRVYGESLSFLRYSNQLLEVMCLLRPDVVSNAELENNPNWDSMLMRYRLSKTVSERLPIPAELALAWLKFYPEYNLKMPARRCSLEFDDLFKRLYKKKYESGFRVTPNKTRLNLSYNSASPSLGWTKITEEDLPDPSMIPGYTKRLVVLADECTDALESYSRYVGRNSSGRQDLEALLLLPDELNHVADSYGLDKFKEWAEKSIQNHNGLVKVTELWEFTDQLLPDRLNKRETDLIERLAEKCGFGIVPTRQIHHARPDTDGKYVLFRDGHGKDFKPSDAFHEMGMALRLGAMVAAIDSEIDPSETAFLNQLIEHDTNLTSTEKKSLHAYLLWRLNTPANLRGLKKRVEDLGTQEKAAISQIMINVALADGKVETEEIEKIEKLYGLLGLDKNLVFNDLHRMSTSQPGSVTNGKSTEQVKTGPDLPKTEQEESAETTPEPGKTGDTFHLDESILAIHESQTRDVQSMLSAIFSDDEPEEEMLDEAAEASAEPEYHDDLGIDTDHYGLYEKLINKDLWLNSEFDTLCEEKKLMRSGAIETINDWSFERVGAPVLEEESDAIYVDHEIVLELDQ